MKELSIQQFKQIKRYQMKKYRQQDGLFLVEGYKQVNEIVSSNIELKSIIISTDWETKPLKANPDTPIFRVPAKKFSQLSSQKNPEGILAVCQQPILQPIDESQWVLALDNIQDPGNLGTIIRIADWFGLRDIICSLNTVDCYNPKVIQASMGSIARIQVHYQDLQEYFTQTKQTIYATTLTGKTIPKQPKPGVLVIGNESHGISSELLALSNQQITIPRYGQAESLNAAVATGIVLNGLL